jgi:hypothetical protein
MKYLFSVTSVKLLTVISSIKYANQVFKPRLTEV